MRDEVKATKTVNDISVSALAPFAVLFFALILFLGVTDVIAEPRVTIRTNYYEVRGSAVAELTHELNSKTPIRHEGKIYRGYTASDVKWRFTSRNTDTSCTISTVTVMVDIVFTLPKWINSGAADNELKNKWDRYYKALVDHENGHKDIIVSSAREIEKAILNMRPRQICNVLWQDANNLGRQILEKSVRLSKEYDIETGYGVKYGAAFP